jgi:hypothetical protein
MKKVETITFSPWSNVTERKNDTGLVTPFGARLSTMS